VAASCGSHYPKVTQKRRTKSEGYTPPSCSAPLFSFQAIVIIIGVRTFHGVFLYYICKCSKNQSGIVLIAVVEEIEKEKELLPLSR